jgi:hypothetical protein
MILVSSGNSNNKYCDTWTHCQVTAVLTCDGTTAVAWEQLCGHVVSPVRTEHTIMKETLFAQLVPGLHKNDH